VLDWSVQQRVVFWWVLFFIMHQVERWWLLPEVINAELPSNTLLFQTFETGCRADLITSTAAIVLVTLLAGLVSLVSRAITGRRGATTFSASVGRALTGCGVLVGLLFVIVLLLDVTSYRDHQQRVTFAFFEYLRDLPARWTQTGFIQSRAEGQGGVGSEGGKWVEPVLGFLLCESVAILAWWRGYAKLVRPLLSRWSRGAVLAPSLILLLALSIGLTGFHRRGPGAVLGADISSTAYYTLAQNSVLYAGEGLLASLHAQRRVDQGTVFDEVPLPEAVHLTRELIAPKEVFPYEDYPLLHHPTGNAGLRLSRPADILIIVVNALDRRYLNKTVGGVPVTPFLDQLRNDSVYFEHFFANGAQTAQGLFSALCSYYPRQGTAAIQTHYMHDYACLPSLLRERAYRTEMATGHDLDVNRLQVFMSRNGLHEFFDRSTSDAALLNLMRTRIEALRAMGRRYCFVAMTTGPYRPSTVPASAAHPDITALQKDPDPYLAVLRSVDLELERVLTAMKRDGLLQDTVVLIFGDHGRQEKLGQSDFERQAGHFMTPLFLWLDDSLRTPVGYQPRTVTTVASQVDVLPTILGLNGGPPRLSASVGRDLSCLLASDCIEQNAAFLSSVDEDLIGLADEDGVLLYSLRTRTLRRDDLDLHEPAVVLDAANPAVAHRYRRLLALYVAANLTLNQNKIWSWKEFGSKL